MPTASSHVLAKRTYWGEETGKILVDWLNKKGRQQNLVAAVLDALTTLTRPSAFASKKQKAAMERNEGPAVKATSWDSEGEVVGRLYMPGADAKRVTEVTWQGKKMFVPLSDPFEYVRHAEVLFQVNKAIARIYKVVPQFGNQIGNRWVLNWMCGKGPEAEAAHAAHQIVHLAEKGLLYRVRRCGNCRKWFFARFNHSRFCTVVCQQKGYRSSPEWKAHRREYMKEYTRKNYQRRG